VATRAVGVKSSDLLAGCGIIHPRRIMPRMKGKNTKKMKSRHQNVPRTSEGAISSTGPNRTRSNRTRPSVARKDASQERVATKRSNESSCTPQAKRQHGQRQNDDSSDGKSNEAPLTKADIPKIVEAVRNQFSRDANDSQNEDQDDPHLGMFVCQYLHFRSNHVMARRSCEQQ